MSAFMCSNEHVNRILDTAAKHDQYGGLYESVLPKSESRSRKASLTLAGQMMLAENLKSMRYRYPDIAGEELDGYIAQIRDYVYVPGGDEQIDEQPVNALSLIASWRYQSCEHPDHDKVIWDMVDGLEQVLIRALPGYSKAPWSV